VVDGNWHHLVGVWTDGSQKLYVDGQLATSATDSMNITDGGDASIGAINLGSFIPSYNGLMDDVAIWNRALSASEVVGLYNSYGYYTGVALDESAPSVFYTSGEARSYIYDNVYSSPSGTGGSGTCDGSPSNPYCFWEYYDQESCAAYSYHYDSCYWNYDYSYCEDYMGLNCTNQATSDACGAVTGCSWAGGSSYVYSTRDTVFDLNLNSYYPTNTSIGVGTRTASAYSYPSGLVGAWNFNDGTANDSSGNANNGTITGATSAEDGVVGRSMSFDGSSEVSLSEPDITGNNPYSIYLWVKPSSSTDDKAIISFGNSSQREMVVIAPENSNKITVLHYSADHSYSQTFAVGVWQNIVVTYDGTTEKLYYNGTYSESTTPGTLNINGSVMKFGNWFYTDSKWSGDLDEVQVYDRALTAGEILSLYNNYGLNFGSWSSDSTVTATSQTFYGTDTTNFYQFRTNLATTDTSQTSMVTGFSVNRNPNVSDVTPPVQSDWSPASDSATNDSTPTITLTLDETGDCKSSTTDQAYSAMTTDCTGDGTTSISCTTSDLGSDGSKTVYIACNDSLSNADTAGTNTALTYTLDTVAPTTTDNYTVANNNWQSSAQTITLTPADDNSGISWTKYCTDTENSCNPSTGTSYTTPVVISTENISYFRYASQDNAGNTQTTVSRTVKIDTTAPTTTASANYNYTFGQVSTSQITVTLTCSDGSGTGCLTTLYCVDQANTCTPNTTYNENQKPLTSTTGTSYIRYSSNDILTNTETTTSQTIIVQPSPSGSAGEQTVATPTTPTTPETPATIVDQIQQGTQNVTNQLSEIATVIGQITSQIASIFGNNQIAIVTPNNTSILQGVELMDVNPLGGLNLVQNNLNINNLAQEIPQLQDTLNSLSIDLSNPEALQLLSTSQLFLPGINELSALPTDIVFAQTAEGTIDLNSMLTVDEQGNVIQAISTIAGTPMQLTFVPDQPAKNVTGLVITSTNQPTALNTQPQNFFAKLFTAALTFSSATPKVSTLADGLVVDKFNYIETKPGVFTASITSPAIEGQYKIVTVVEYKDKNLAPTQTEITALVDPEGYVYQKMNGNELRIKDATVSLFVKDSSTQEFTLWPSEKYMQQNPIVTDNTGKYSFLVPPGTYYLTATAKNYQDYKSDEFVVQNNKGITINIELKPKATWHSWLTIQIATVILLLVIIIMLVVILQLRRHKLT
jgi:hypothetical protein